MKHFNLLFAFTLLLSQLVILQADELSELLKNPELMAKLKENPNDVKTMVDFGKTNFSAAMSLTETDPDQAEKHLDAISAFYQTLEPESAEAKKWQALAVTTVNTFKQQIKIIRIPFEELEARLKKDPDDTEAISFYGQKTYLELRSKARENPHETEETLAKLETFLTKVAEKSEKEASQTAYTLAKRSFLQIQVTIEKQYKILAAIGKDTIPLGIEQWTNGAPIIDDELKGKVVLLDFWAVWCGPCVATFPHLVEWNQEHADDGLVILGLTSFYQYQWDEETQKAVQSKEPVEPEIELATLAKFAQSHNLEHRIGIQPKDKSLGEHFAVSNIPHMVLIDRQGKNPN
ncbi:MAG: TlpA disulfide reductase family protein [Pirellulales bacterium]